MQHVALDKAFQGYLHACIRIQEMREGGRKVVLRMQRGRLWAPFAALQEAVEEARAAKENEQLQQAAKAQTHARVVQVLRKSILRMQHVALDKAFQALVEAVGRSKHVHERCGR
eukprot:1664036-Rhodomonas_salina.1